MRSRCSISRRLRRPAPVRFRPEGWLSRRVSFLARRRKRITMLKTVSSRRDRPGHYWRARLRRALRLASLRSHFAARSAPLALALALTVAPSAAAADYTANRFDVVAAVAESGDLHVRERIVFTFESGTFKRVWREISASRTDGI